MGDDRVTLYNIEFLNVTRGAGISTARASRATGS